MAAYDKNICPPTPRNICVVNHAGFRPAVEKMEEIRDFYFKGCELLVQPETGGGDNYVMFNIMNGNGKPVQSFLWDIERSTRAGIPAFHDWTVCKAKHQQEKAKKVKKGKKNRGKR